MLIISTFLVVFTVNYDQTVAVKGLYHENLGANLLVIDNYHLLIINLIYLIPYHLIFLILYHRICLILYHLQFTMKPLLYSHRTRVITSDLVDVYLFVQKNQ